MQRSAAGAYVKRMLYAGSDIFLCRSHRLCGIHAAGQISGYGGGKSASGAVGVFSVYSTPRKNSKIFPVIQQINRLAA